jgi:hypothetical protein
MSHLIVTDYLYLMFLRPPLTDTTPLLDFPHRHRLYFLSFRLIELKISVSAKLKDLIQIIYLNWRESDSVTVE